jgi:uncharacterized membrane protein
MKKLFALFLVTGLISCEQIEKIDKQMDADSADIANEIADMKAEAQRQGANLGNGELLYKAVGSEPGWYAEFYTNKFRMLMNYGEDSIVLFREFKQGGDLNFTYKNEENGQKVNMNVKLEDKVCTDAAGGKNPNTVTVQFNEKTFVGCGTPVKK